MTDRHGRASAVLLLGVLLTGGSTRAADAGGAVAIEPAPSQNNVAIVPDANGAPTVAVTPLSTPPVSPTPAVTAAPPPAVTVTPPAAAAPVPASAPATPPAASAPPLPPTPAVAVAPDATAGGPPPVVARSTRSFRRPDGSIATVTTTTVTTITPPPPGAPSGDWTAASWVAAIPVAPYAAHREGSLWRIAPRRGGNGAIARLDLHQVGIDPQLAGEVFAGHATLLLQGRLVHGRHGTVLLATVVDGGTPDPVRR